jgi:hypothetical protein
MPPDIEWPDEITCQARAKIGTIGDSEHKVPTGVHRIGQHSIIKTAPSRGYRFVAPVSSSGFDATSSTLPSPEAYSDELRLPDRPSIAVLPFHSVFPISRI